MVCIRSVRLESRPLAAGTGQQPRARPPYRVLTVGAVPRCRVIVLPESVPGKEAAISGTPDDGALGLPGLPQPGAGQPAAPLRWRRVFPGQEEELRSTRYWLAGLLPDYPSRADVLTVATELAANAVRHSASGRGGYFAVEISWLARPATIRIAVADGGGPASPAGLAALSLPGTSLPAVESLTESGRGLRLVRALALRAGMCGDERAGWSGPTCDGTPTTSPSRASRTGTAPRCAMCRPCWRPATRKRPSGSGRPPCTGGPWSVNPRAARTAGC